MSRALSRTMKLPNTEKPFQCNVCEKQVTSTSQRWRRTKLFFSVLLPMTSRFVYVLESFSLFAVSSIKHASESYEDTHGRKAVQWVGRDGELWEILTSLLSFAECHVCSREFRQSSTLTNHIKIHTGEKPYSELTEHGEGGIDGLWSERSGNLLVVQGQSQVDVRTMTSWRGSRWTLTWSFAWISSWSSFNLPSSNPTSPNKLPTNSTAFFLLPKIVPFAVNSSDNLAR
jgi:hypothetical protein